MTKSKFRLKGIGRKAVWGEFITIEDLNKQLNKELNEFIKEVMNYGMYPKDISSIPKEVVKLMLETRFEKHFEGKTV